MSSQASQPLQVAQQPAALVLGVPAAEALPAIHDAKLQSILKQIVCKTALLRFWTLAAIVRVRIYVSLILIVHSLPLRHRIFNT